MERREKRMRVTGKHILLKGILGVYSMYAFAVLVVIQTVAVAAAVDW